MTLNAKDAVLQGLRNLRAEGKRFFTLDYLRQKMPACTIGRAWMTQCLNDLGCRYDKKLAAWVDKRACIADAEYAPYRDQSDNQSLKQQLAERNADIEYLKASVVNLTFKNKELTKENNSLQNDVHDLQCDLHTQEDMILDLQEFIKKFVDDLGQPDSTLLFIFGRLQAILSKTDSVKTVGFPKVRSQKKILEEAQDKVGEIMTALVNDDYCSHCIHQIFCKRYNVSETKIRQFIGRYTYCPAFLDLSGDVAELGRILSNE